MLRRDWWAIRIRSLDPAWKFAIGVYLVARIALTAWSLIVFLLFPTVLQNLDLFGTPVVVAFDLQSSARYTFSRQVDDVALTFHIGNPGYMVDMQTGSVWSLRDGSAVSGHFAGRMLTASSYSLEEIFPYRGISPESNVFLSLWQRFDTNWYLAIAARGYALDDGSTVYFPLYPALIHVVSLIVGSPMLAALLISNTALIGALVALYRVGDMLFDPSSAQRAIAYLLLYPAGFFLMAGYTESLFLLLVLSAFMFALRSRWWLAALCGVLAALTRLQGLLLIAPLGLLLWQQTRRASSVTSFRLQALRALLLLSVPLATTMFLTFTSFSLLRSYEGQLHARFVLPWDNVVAAIGLLASGQGSFIDGLNLFVTFVFGGLLIVVWKRLPREYGLYALVTFFAPLFRMTTQQPLVSMTRYVLAMFPAFILLGVWGKNVWVNRALVYLSFPLQLFVSAQFMLWGWVG